MRVFFLVGFVVLAKPTDEVSHRAVSVLAYPSLGAQITDLQTQKE